MEADSGYDTTNFQALRAELSRLNDRVRRRGRNPRDAALDPSASDGSAKRIAGRRLAAKRPAAKRASPKAVASRKTAKAPESSVKRASEVTPESKARHVKSAKSAPKDQKKAGTKRSQAKTNTAKTNNAKANNAKTTKKAKPGNKVKAADKGKARARRLLTILGRIAGDESSAVPGTDFTEAGVVRLMSHLRKRRSQTSPFLVRLQRVLSRPVAMGMRTSAGVSVERLQVVSRQLHDLATLGWARFQELRAARRAKQAPPRLDNGAVAPHRPITPHKAKAAVPEPL